MKPPVMSLLVLPLLILAAALATSRGSPPAGPTPVTVDQEAQTPIPAVLVEIQAAMTEHREQRAKLEQRFDNAPDEFEAIEIQREIEALVHANEIQILTIQLKHLRSANRVDEVQRLERSLEEMASLQRQMSDPESQVPKTSNPRR